MTGSECRAKRIARGWTQCQLAARARVAKSTIAKFESGHVATQPGNVRRIEKALRVERVPAQALPTGSLKQALGRHLNAKVQFVSDTSGCHDWEMIGT